MAEKGFLIVFTGIDGSGKSTQAQLLTDELASRGVPAQYVWARWEPNFLKPASALARTLSRRKKRGCGIEGDKDARDYANLKSTKTKILSLPGVRSLWLLLAALDYFMQVRRKIVQPLKEGKIIVCDRYRSDFLADLAINFRCRGAALAKLASHPLMKLFPAPGLAFYIAIPPEVGFKRKSDGTSTEYLADRIEVYSQLADIDSMYRLDGTLPVEAVSAAVAEQVRKLAL